MKKSELKQIIRECIEEMPKIKWSKSTSASKTHRKNVESTKRLKDRTEGSYDVAGWPTHHPEGHDETHDGNIFYNGEWDRDK